jgi:small subunit ribosomal protein S18
LSKASIRKKKKIQADRDSNKKLREMFARKKVCKFCVKKLKEADYKDAAFLKSFMAESGRILPRKNTGNCAKHQRMTAKAIKRARNAGFLAFMNR